jgi:hypothetical protein
LQFSAKHPAAENAIKELKGGGFDIKKLAVVGRDYQMSSVSITQATG